MFGDNMAFGDTPISRVLLTQRGAATVAVALLCCDLPRRGVELDLPREERLQT